MGCSGFGFGWCVVEKERDKEEKSLNQRGRENRERSDGFIFILLGSLYYFIGLYVKIRNEMLGVLLNELVKYIKITF